MKAAYWIVFGVMAAAQIAVPLHMIMTSEHTLQTGTAYRFRCGTVDPYDYFRGRYVTLSFRDTTLENWQGARFDRGDLAFARLGVDGEGFARIEDVTSVPPDSGDYLAVSAFTGGGMDKRLWVRLPFDKYFMNEFDAPAAEAAYRDQSRTEEGAYAVVRVRDGQGVIEGLFLDEVPIEEYLLRETATAPAP